MKHTSSLYLASDHCFSHGHFPEKPVRRNIALLHVYSESLSCSFWPQTCYRLSLDPWLLLLTRSQRLVTREALGIDGGGMALFRSLHVYPLGNLHSNSSSHFAWLGPYSPVPLFLEFSESIFLYTVDIIILSCIRRSFKRWLSGKVLKTRHQIFQVPANIYLAQIHQLCDAGEIIQLPDSLLLCWLILEVLRVLCWIFFFEVEST